MVEVFPLKHLEQDGSFKVVSEARLDVDPAGKNGIVRSAS